MTRTPWPATRPSHHHFQGVCKRPSEPNYSSSRHTTQTLTAQQREREKESPSPLRVFSSAQLVFKPRPHLPNSSALGADGSVSSSRHPYGSSYIPGCAGGCSRTFSHSAPYETHLPNILLLLAFGSSPAIRFPPSFSKRPSVELLLLPSFTSFPFPTFFCPEFFYFEKAIDSI